MARSQLNLNFLVCVRKVCVLVCVLANPYSVFLGSSVVPSCEFAGTEFDYESLAGQKSFSGRIRLFATSNMLFQVG